MSLDKKRAFLEGNETSPRDVEKLLASVRVCASGKISSCKHSGLEVLNTKIENKLDRLCDMTCKKLRKGAEERIKTAEENALAALASEQRKVVDYVEKVNNIVAAL